MSKGYEIEYGGFVKDHKTGKTDLMFLTTISQLICLNRTIEKANSAMNITVRIMLSAAERSVGSREAPEAASMEIRNLLEDYEKYSSRMDELMAKIEEKIKEVPYVDKLLEIKGIGLKTVCGFIAEVGDLSRFDDPKQLQKLAGYAIVKNSSGKHAGESHISYRGGRD